MKAKECKKLAIEALTNLKGDDTARARACFRGLGPKQMQEEHGQSGRTRAEVLADYEAHDARVDAAIQWVKDAQ